MGVTGVSPLVFEDMKEKEGSLQVSSGTVLSLNELKGQKRSPTFECMQMLGDTTGLLANTVSVIVIIINLGCILTGFIHKPNTYFCQDNAYCCSLFFNLLYLCVVIQSLHSIRPFLWPLLLKENYNCFCRPKFSPML